jgi:FtsH-binding integral membrane protein
LDDDPGQDVDPRDQIMRIEERIEELTDVIESCRKIMLASKLAIAAGATWLVAFTLGATGFHPMAMIAAMAAVIGGIVVFGSNMGTSKQAAAAVKEAQALRTELIDKINPRLVN